MLAKSFADEVVEHSAKLRGYARKLAGSRSAADDIVQETILRALVHSDQFKAGTNLSAWLCTILRNCYFNDLRRSRQVSALNEGISPQQPPIDADQMWAVQAKETAQHIAALPRAPTRGPLARRGGRKFVRNSGAKGRLCERER